MNQHGEQEKLIERALSATLTKEEEAQLYEWIKNDPEFAARYVMVMREDSMLYDILHNEAAEVGNSFVRRTPTPTTNMWRIGWFAATAAMLMVACGLWFWSGQKTILTVVSSTGDATWTANGEPLPVRPGDVLPAGSELRLASDASVTIRYSGESTTATLLANTVARPSTIGGGKLILLERGGLVCDVERQSVPMRVETGTASMIVRGTRFSVLALNDGAALEVERGAVEMVRSADAKSVVVHGGEYAVVWPETDLAAMGSPQPEGGTEMEIKNRLARLTMLVCLAAGMPSAFALEWTPQPGAGKARVEGKKLLLELGKKGTAGLKSKPIPVKPNASMYLSFIYAGDNLSAGKFDGHPKSRRGPSPLIAQLRWLDEKGVDIDEHRAGLGFSPLAREWRFVENSAKPRRVADNFSVPGEARAAEISFRLEVTIPPGKKDRGAVTAAIGDVALRPGQTNAVGIEMNSGPADAGPLCARPAGHRFAANLVPNAAFEEGEDTPAGWKIEGDNANASAVWQEGGAFSGRRCLKLIDRGPYVKSWGEENPSVYVPGGKPGGNVAFSREEVSARWVSEPSPAQPGAVYQATAFLWYLNRHRITSGGAAPMNANPVRIQFLDAAGKVLPYADVWQDWIPGERPFVVEGWARVLSRPAVAPANAVSVRLAVVMHHAFYHRSKSRKIPSNRGFVLADNIALYRVQSEGERQARQGKSPLEPEDVFWDTAKAGGLPFVPTSAAHRPDSLSAESESGYPGGILFAPADPRTKPLNLRVRNWIGDKRDVEIRCKVEDWLGRSILEKNLPVTLPPYGTGLAAIAYPAGLPLGAYTVSYVIREAGDDRHQSMTRFAVLAKRETTPEERGRDDYPFAIWTPYFPQKIGGPYEAFTGKMLDAAGMGKSWYAGKVDINSALKIKDPVARRRAVEKDIAEARVKIAGHRRYGITPMGYLHARIYPESERKRLEPVLEEVITQVVLGLKDEIHWWRWGNEFVNGKATELDREGMLYWGHKGTVRQYWQTYRVAYHAAKAADPNCVFGPASASDTQDTVLRLFFQVCKPGELDSFGMNTYINAFAMWPHNLSRLSAAGIPDLPLYISEFSPQPRNDYAIRKNYAETSAVKAVRRRVTGWVEVLTSFPNMFHCAQTWLWRNGDDSQNMLRENRVRPSFVAFAAMTNILGAGRFVERVELPEAVMYVRQRSLRPGLVGVLYSTVPKDVVVDIQVGSSSVVVADVMGNRRRVAAPGGVATIPVTPMPQYLLGAKKLGSTVAPPEAPGAQSSSGVGTHSETSAVGHSAAPAAQPGEAREAAAGRLLQSARTAEAQGQTAAARGLYSKTVLEYSETDAAEQAFRALERMGVFEYVE